jgi:hypothetical protein
MVVLHPKSLEDNAKRGSWVLTLEIQPPFDAALLPELWGLPEAFGVIKDAKYASWHVAVPVQEPLSWAGSHRVLAEPVFGQWRARHR